MDLLSTQQVASFTTRIEIELFCMGVAKILPGIEQVRCQLWNGQKLGIHRVAKIGKANFGKNGNMAILGGIHRVAKIGKAKFGKFFQVSSKYFSARVHCGLARRTTMLQGSHAGVHFYLRNFDNNIATSLM